MRGLLGAGEEVRGGGEERKDAKNRGGRAEEGR